MALSRRGLWMCEQWAQKWGGVWTLLRGLQLPGRCEGHRARGVSEELFCSLHEMPALDYGGKDRDRLPFCV